MLLQDLLNHLNEYIKSTEYLKGIFVEITGVAIEILLIVILIPVFLHIYNLHKFRQIRFIANFYIFQVFHKISRMFLSMSSIEDPLPILLKEMEKNNSFMIYSHYIYGNLENIFYVLRSNVFSGDLLQTQLSKKGINKLKEYEETTRGAIDEIDRLTMMFMSVPRTRDLLFRIRLLIYPIRDVIENLIDSIDKKSEGLRRKSLYDLERIGATATFEMEKVFQKERKIIDSIMTHRNYLQHCYLLLKLPLILIAKLGSKILSMTRRREKRHNEKLE